MKRLLVYKPAAQRELGALPDPGGERAYLAHRRAAFGERQELSGQALGALESLVRQIQMWARRAACVQLRSRQVQVAEQAAEQVVEVVRNAGSQHAQRLELGRALHAER